MTDSRYSKQRIDAPELLADLLQGSKLVIAPGCYDAVTAKLVAHLGFSAAYVSGASVSAVTLGLPDLGFVGPGEILSVAARVVDSVSPVPVIVDADTGFGEEIHVDQTVQRYERAGIAALHLEDQVLPKRCGHMVGKRLVDINKACQRIEVAVKARKQMLVIARTDALSVEGTDSALVRAQAYASAGADVIFIEGLTSLDEIRSASSVLPVPLMVSLSEAGGPIDLNLRDISQCGASLAIVPISGLLSAISGYKTCLKNLIEKGTVGSIDNVSWSELNEILDLPRFEMIESFGKGSSDLR